MASRRPAVSQTRPAHAEQAVVCQPGIRDRPRATRSERRVGESTGIEVRRDEFRAPVLLPGGLPAKRIQIARSSPRLS